MTLRQDKELNGVHLHGHGHSETGQGEAAVGRQP